MQGGIQASTPSPFKQTTTSSLRSHFPGGGGGGGGGILVWTQQIKYLLKSLATIIHKKVHKHFGIISWSRINHKMNITIKIG